MYLPLAFKQIAADPKHPFYNPIAQDHKLVILLNGELFDHDAIIVDCINGFIKAYRHDKHGQVLTKHVGRQLRCETYYAKGKVELFMEVSSATDKGEIG